MMSKRKPVKLRQRWHRLVRRRLWGMDIARDAWIAPTAYIDRTWPRGIHIGTGVVIEDEASILTHDMTRGLYRDTHIGDNARIGPRAIVMPGITIGARAIVDPGSIVNRDVGEGERVRGNPARIVDQD